MAQEMRLWALSSGVGLTLARFINVLVLVALMAISTLGYNRNRPITDCAPQGHKRLISVPGCLEFNATTNGCRGYCPSCAYPTPIWLSDDRPITSEAQCCSIKDTHSVVYRVRCFDKIRPFVFKTFVFKSASTCECSSCSND
ncbi:hypothetical protein CAPTEDRAFT_222558 [Capitella teleta]|uniref:Glycoprotein hormone subunit beta domain-containing protein n=1 Tax=Capitella teleta TaxID=283909 RepID=R7US47_CAPTE|nr:hypothetical protein CAPTEDRAFT_222558 [Capitella teleta]|eukprot:ELU06221.1 hypothetical protein CAPTEDRAFT_222558 [Capitella teleta]